MSEFDDLIEDEAPTPEKGEVPYTETEEFKAKANMAAGRPWYVLADIADFSAQKPEVNVYVEKTMAYARANGMVRAANLVSSALSKMQISRLSQETGLPSFSFFQAESEAIRWLISAA